MAGLRGRAERGRGGASRLEAPGGRPARAPGDGGPGRGELRLGHDPARGDPDDPRAGAGAGPSRHSARPQQPREGLPDTRPDRGGGGLPRPDAGLHREDAGGRPPRGRGRPPEPRGRLRRRRRPPARRASAAPARARCGHPRQGPRGRPSRRGHDLPFDGGGRPRPGASGGGPADAGPPGRGQADPRGPRAAEALARGVPGPAPAATSSGRWRSARRPSGPIIGTWPRASGASPSSMSSGATTPGPSRS